MLCLARRHAHINLACLCLSESGNLTKGLRACRRALFTWFRWRQTVRWLTRTPLSWCQWHRKVLHVWKRFRLASNVKIRSWRADVIRGRPVRLRSQTLLGSSRYLVIMPRTVLAGIYKARPTAAAHIPAIVIPMARHLCPTLVFPLPSCSEYWQPG